MTDSAQVFRDQTVQHWRRYWAWWLLALVMLAAALVRARLLSAPIERDEGEYAYAGQLILQGLPPYSNLYHIKLPGIYLAYAGILAAFGQTVTAIHLGLLLVNLLTILLVFLLARTVLDDVAAITAAAVFALLSVSQQVQGIYANSEHFVLPFAVGGLGLLLLAERRGRWWGWSAAGFLLGGGVLMKQPGGAFVLAGLVWVAVHELGGSPASRSRGWRRVGAFVGGAALPYLVTCLVMWRLGIFGQFWEWTFEHAILYGSDTQLAAVPTRLLEQSREVCRAAALPLGLAAVGVTALWWHAPARPRWDFLLLTGAGALLALCVGFQFRPHYYVFVLPWVALFAGVGGSALAAQFQARLSRRAAVAAAAAVVLVSLGVTLAGQWRFLVILSPTAATAETYPGNGFVESVQLGEFLARATRPDERIAVVGSEPQLYFYARRRAATGFVYTYTLMEPQPFALPMQQQMIAEITAAQPRYVVFVQNWTSWLRRPTSPTLIFRWFEEYQKQYELALLLDLERSQLLRPEETPWPPTAESWIAVLRRRPPR